MKAARFIVFLSVIFIALITGISEAGDLDGCRYIGKDTIYRIDDTRNGIIHHMKQKVEVYEKDYFLYYKPLWVKIWWTRKNSKFFVRQAQLDYGCQWGRGCDDSKVDHVVRYEPFRPSWQEGENRTITYKFTWSGPRIPFFPNADVGTPIQANSSSKVYKQTSSGRVVYKGETYVETSFP